MAIKAQSHTDWTKVDAIVCMRRKVFPSARRGQCAVCGHTIWYSRLMRYPADLKKICEVCAKEEKHAP
jgi:hypothetical protein